MNLQQRYYQDESINNINTEFDNGTNRQLVVLPTGTGKTVVFAKLLTRFRVQGKWLVLAHRDELVGQAKDKILRWNPTLKAGIEMGSRWAEETDDVVVGSVQTLGLEGSERIKRFNPAQFAGVIVDEAHHIVADTYMRVLQHFGLHVPGAKRLLLGVTATDKRGDGKPLNTVLDKTVYEMSMFRAVQEGWLVDLRGYKVSTSTSLDKVRTVAGDFNKKELEQAVNTVTRNRSIVETWLEKGENRQTVVFTVDIEHARDLAKVARDYKIEAQPIWGTDPEREAKLAAHRAGQIKWLCNANVLTEGYDDPSIACVIPAAPTKSPLRYVQQVGRGTRLPESVDNLISARKTGVKLEKEDCIIIDPVDNTTKHSLMTLAAVEGMNARLDLRGKSVFAVKKQLAETAEQYPQVDLSRLDDVAKLDRLVEQVDLWQVRYPEEILRESTMQWHKTADGAYVLYLSGTEGIRLWQSAMGTWEFFLNIGQNRKHLTDFETRRDALQTAERLFKLMDSKRSYFARRENNAMKKMADVPATMPQLSLLRNLGVTFPPTISKADASRLITQYKSKAFRLNN